MSDYYNRLFVAVPAALQGSFRQHGLLTVVSRIRWVFWASLILQAILFSIDWLRYNPGRTLPNGLFRTKAATANMIW